MDRDAQNDKRRAIYTHGYHENRCCAVCGDALRSSAGYLLPYLVPGLSVLDVGCGPGTSPSTSPLEVVPGSVTIRQPMTP